MTRPGRRQLLQRAGTLLAAACALPGVLRAAPAQRPNKPVRLIVVYPPGGVSDGMARVLAEPLARSLGVPVIIENRPGAGGSLGMDALARSAPDGSTLAFSAISPLTLHPLLARVPYDPMRAFMPVASVMRTPVLVVGTPAFTGRGFGELIAQARRQPGEVRWATSGVATIGHLVLAQVRVQSGTDITHIPYQGGGPQLNDALSGQFEVLSTNVAAQQLRYIEGGRFQALAVGAPARIEALPRCPRSRNWASRRPTAIRSSASSRRHARRARWCRCLTRRSTACSKAKRCARGCARPTTCRRVAAATPSRTRLHRTGGATGSWSRATGRSSTECGAWPTTSRPPRAEGSR